MSATLGVSPSRSGHGRFSSLRHAIRKFFEHLGLETAPRAHSSRFPKRTPSYSRGIFPTLPHDYIRRRRATRRISNVILVVLLSVAVAYVIVHFSGPAPFSAPHH